MGKVPQCKKWRRDGWCMEEGNPGCAEGGQLVISVHWSESESPDLYSFILSRCLPLRSEFHDCTWYREELAAEALMGHVLRAAHTGWHHLNGKSSTFDPYFSRVLLHNTGHETRGLLRCLAVCSVLSLLSALGCANPCAKKLGKDRSQDAVSQSAADTVTLRSVT